MHTPDENMQSVRTFAEEVLAKNLKDADAWLADSHRIVERNHDRLEVQQTKCATPHVGGAGTTGLQNALYPPWSEVISTAVMFRAAASSPMMVSM